MRILFSFLAVFFSFFHSSTTVACSKVPLNSHLAVAHQVEFQLSGTADNFSNSPVIIDIDNDDVNESENENYSSEKISRQELSFVPYTFFTLVTANVQQLDSNLLPQRWLFIYYSVFRL